ncbi:hypothetical protein TTHERM_01097890 (macronuclear) [Tetrahymena thermophila SB210]|uniref:Transmembrane protein n=1 Tax=Tetrahymena thermophila (strain SB210) TaxID=312017 RepID=Q22ZG8_TETTS|nr:hypothetical protein TTHERM_01097890 [Tetrahymena thermophila SB210]EAR90679.2 hypothetical protein TTHERM_01097890 [Tetrahymena thermophila SB210]|eukprot:XP_001010924.2 hypothetical protein TTHERM_01097890 [Tetrahymena thermophila SB210]
MIKIILLALLVSITSCKLTFLNASYSDDPSKQVEIILDDQLKSEAIIDGYGSLNIQFNLWDFNTYFTSQECRLCQYYGKEKIVNFVCEEENNCVKTGKFQKEPIGQFIASGDIINFPFMINQKQFYFNNVMYVKDIVANIHDKDLVYISQGIGLALKGYNRDVRRASIYESLYQQNKIDHRDSSFYYGSDNKYHFVITGYEKMMIPLLFKQLIVNESYYINSIETYFEFNIKFCDRFIHKNLITYVDPTMDDEEWILSDVYFQDFYKIIDEKRLLPDHSIYTANHPGQWSSIINEFTLELQLKLENNEVINFQYTAEEVMKKIDNYYTLKLQFASINHIYHLKIGKSLYKKFLFLKYQNENKDYVIGIKPIEQKLAYSF